MENQRYSRTALVVAAGQVFAGYSRTPEIRVDPAALVFAEKVLTRMGKAWMVRAARSPLLRWLLRLWESVTVPGIANHQALRKEKIDSLVRLSLENGVARVTQVGTGFDSLCLRLHRNWPEVQFIECDHASTQYWKRKIVMASNPSKNLSFREMDLAEEPETTVTESPRSATIVVEGVLMYLPEASVRQWLRFWREDCAPGSRLIFTFLEGSGFRNQTRLARWWLNLVKEPFRWLADPELVSTLLGDTGWKMESAFSSWDTVRSVPVAEGEWVVSAVAV